MKFFVLVAWFTCTALWGQATAQIHGTILDDSGAAVPGAQIKATQTETGLSRTSNSGPHGSYVLTNLPVGPYQVEVSKQGFTKYVQSGITLQVNADPAIEVALRVGSVSEQIVVEANVTQVETRNSGIGEVVQTKRIVDLPLNGRNTTDLITLAGAAVSTGGTPQRFFNNLPMVSIAGQPQSASGGGFGTDYSLDGAYHLNYITGTTMPVAFPDAVQEFKVESSGQTAQRGSASSISIVTKSGSNAFHGNVFEFLRNNAFGSAREYFSTNTGLKRHQFGGTLGGPILKNKLFFFGAFQATTIRQNPGNSIATVPTRAMANGDWSDFASAGCNGGAARTLRSSPTAAPFPNNQVPVSSYSGPAVFIVNTLLSSLAANGLTPDKCGVVTYNTPTKENDYQYVGKIDYQLSPKQSLFFRLLDTPLQLYNSQSFTPAASFNLLTLGVFGSGSLAHSYAVGHTYLQGSSLVQSFRASVVRTSGFKTVPNIVFDYCDAGVRLYCGYEPDPHWFGSLNISGGFNLTTGGGGTPNGFTNTGYAINDDVGYVRGSHQLNFGVGAVRGQLQNLTSSNTAGNFTFNGTVSGAGLGMLDFFLGLPNQFTQGRATTTQNRQNAVNLYITDSWKISPRLTINYGLRWEPFLPMTVVNGRFASFDMNGFLRGVRSTVFVNAPYGFAFPGDAGFPGKQGVYRRWNQFTPRGGLVWDPRGDGKMSVRASYYLGYSAVPGLARLEQRAIAPWGGLTTVINPQSFTNPWADFAGGNPFPYEVTRDVIFARGGEFLVHDYNLPTPRNYSWNVSVQRQIGVWLASATYLGSRVTRLYVNLPINSAGLVPGPIVASGCAATATNCNAQANIQARRVLSLLNPEQGQFVGNMARWDPSGMQSYQGMLLSAQKRLSRGITASANWTWSHCISSAAPINSAGATTVTVAGNPQFDKGNCPTDRRHIVNFTAVAQMPRFSSQVLRWVANGWQLAGVYKFTSGTPLNITNGADRQLSGINNQRPKLLSVSPYTSDDGPGAQYLKPVCPATATVCGSEFGFQQQALGTTGNLGAYSLVGPTYWDLDIALSRQFRFREQHVLELRADAFNFTNSYVSSVTAPLVGGGFSIPTSLTALNSNQFGKIVNAQPARQVQFALKYSF